MVESPDKPARRNILNYMLGAGTAATLGAILYHLLTTRQPYEDTHVAAAEARYRQRSEVRLRAHARALGYHLVPAAPVAGGVS